LCWNKQGGDILKEMAGRRVERAGGKEGREREFDGTGRQESRWARSQDEEE